MLDKSIIGQESPPKTVMAESGQMKFFAKATGAVDPVYWDEAVAKAAGHPALPAAPTFLFCLNNFAPSKGPSIIAQLGIDIRLRKKKAAHCSSSSPKHRPPTNVASLWMV